jgi:hypothetical protein
LCAGAIAALAQPGPPANAGNPFHDKNESGETVHTLPAPASIHAEKDSQPTFAPPSNLTAVYGASYGSGNLVDHGGLEISNAGFQAVYYNSTVANSKATSLGYSSIQAQITAFIKAFPDNAKWDGGANDDFALIQQYGSHAPIAGTLTSNPANPANGGGPFVDKKTAAATFQDSQVQSYLAALFNAHSLTAQSNVIYGIYFPAGMNICLSGGCSCSSFCGYHSHFTYGSLQIKYAVFPFPGCNACSVAGMTAADMLTIIGSHEIREAVTDPGDFGNYAWADAAGYEADDKCAWHNLYQMANGKFWVQPEYSNGGIRTASGFTATYPGPGCIVPNK